MGGREGPDAEEKMMLAEAGAHEAMDRGVRMTTRRMTAKV